jgi:hypothetical protein
MISLRSDDGGHAHTWVHDLHVGVREEAGFALTDNGAVPPVASRLRGMSGEDKVLAER